MNSNKIYFHTILIMTVILMMMMLMTLSYLILTQSGIVIMLLSVYAHFLILGLVIINSKSVHLVWLPRDQ